MKPIWQLAKENNEKTRVVRVKEVTAQELRMRPYRTVITTGDIYVNHRNNLRN